MGRLFFRPAHRDASEPAIIKALRAVGASVWPISGKDVPDLLVGYKGLTYLLEVKSNLTNTKKDGYTRKTTTKVSEGQQAFQDSWSGGTVRVVHTPEEALNAIGAPVEGVLPPLNPAGLGTVLERHERRTGHLVTPAYQKAQTAAVVPKRKKRRKAVSGQRAQPVDFSEPPDRPSDLDEC